MAVAIWIPFLKTLYPATSTLSVEADQERLIWLEETGLADKLVGLDGLVVSVGVVTSLETVTETAVEALVFPAASLAIAMRDLEPLVDSVVSHEMEYGEVVSSAPRFTPSSLNWTPETPTLSEAVAVMLTLPETSAPLAGDVRETVGRVVSGAA